MKPTIAIVVDPQVPESWARDFWHVDDLAKALTAAGATVTKVTAGLEAAPESWAFVYFVTSIEEVTDPAAVARLPRTIATLSMQKVCALAEQYKCAGAFHEVSREAYENYRDGAKQSSDTVLAVRRDIAARLGWKLYEFRASVNYAETEDLHVPFAKALLSYLEALLGPTSETPQ
jgi:hypothetical protein